MQRPFFFGTNFKMHHTPAETAAFVRHLRAAPLPAAQVFLIPPFTSLSAANEAKGALWIGAQTMHDADDGAYTGEISARMLAALGVDLVMLGHAERRTQFGETDAALRRKTRRALDYGLRVLLCVGENAFEHECSVTAETVARQLKIALRDVLPTELTRLLVAYEPVWSIGVGGTPAPTSDVAQAVTAIRAALHQQYGAAGDQVPLLYGGSVTAENVAGYIGLAGIDGAFVGRAAWTPAGFLAVLERAYAARRA